MPEISFYVIGTESLQDRNLFACKLLEKAYRSDSFPYVLTDNDEQNRRLDDLLWTFRAGSFIPHQQFSGDLPELERVILISHQQPPQAWRKVVINLSSNCPHDFQSVERILEILDNSEDSKILGRNRYRQYQQAGYEITTHKL